MERRFAGSVRGCVTVFLRNAVGHFSCLINIKVILLNTRRPLEYQTAPLHLSHAADAAAHAGWACPDYGNAGQRHAAPQYGGFADPVTITLQALNSAHTALGCAFTITIPENTLNPGNGYYVIEDTTADIYGLQITQSVSNANY